MIQIMKSSHARLPKPQNGQCHCQLRRQQNLFVQSLCGAHRDRNISGKTTDFSLQTAVAGITGGRQSQRHDFEDVFQPMFRTDQFREGPIPDCFFRLQRLPYVREIIMRKDGRSTKRNPEPREQEHDTNSLFPSPM